MSAQTPMASLQRRGRRILTVNTVDGERLVAECPTVDDARWVFGPLARFHGEVVPVLETDHEPDGRFAAMMEGPHHLGHGAQVQVGWLGHSGQFYPWPTPLGTVHDGEPGGYLPVYVDQGD